jgi:hypothetical protein
MMTLCVKSRRFIAISRSWAREMRLVLGCLGRILDTRHRARGLISILLLVSLVVGTFGAFPAIAAAESQEQQEELTGDEQELVAIGRQVPAYGGMYVDEETQRLYVWLTDDGPSLESAVQRILSTPGYSDLAELTPVALPAQHSFTQLCLARANGRRAIHRRRGFYRHRRSIQPPDRRGSGSQRPWPGRARPAD